MNNYSENSLALAHLYANHYKLKTKEIREQLEDSTSAYELLEELYKEQTSQVLQAIAHTVKGWEEQTGATLSTPYDLSYPKQFMNVWDHPLLVFCKGATDYKNAGDIDLGISVVGTRKPTESARYFVQQLVNYLCDEDVTIISGLAEGIDQTAHRAALARNQRTVGVIGTGFGRYYPQSSRDLQMQMEAGVANSMVLSQFLPMSAPSKISFPMRNGVMSAYGFASIIVEASEKSGTRHQASQAIKHGRALILSEQVAHGTSWGQKYAEDSAIETYVVTTPYEAASAAFDVVEKVQRPSLDLSTATDTF